MKGRVGLLDDRWIDQGDRGIVRRCPQVIDRSTERDISDVVFVCWWGCVYVVGGVITSSLAQIQMDGYVRERRSGWSRSYVPLLVGQGKSAMTRRFNSRSIPSVVVAAGPCVVPIEFTAGGNCFLEGSDDRSSSHSGFAFLRGFIQCNNAAWPRRESSWILTTHKLGAYARTTFCVPSARVIL